MRGWYKGLRTEEEELKTRVSWNRFRTPGSLFHASVVQISRQACSSEWNVALSFLSTFSKNTLEHYRYNTLYTHTCLQGNGNMYSGKFEFLNWEGRAGPFRENENFRVAGRRTSLIKEKSRIIKRSTLIEDATPECEKAYRCRWSRDTKNSPLVLSVDTALLRASKKCQRGDKEWPRGCPRKLEEKAGC